MTIGSSSWTKQQVQQLVDSQQEPYYQRIELPYGLATQGDDRGLTRDLIFPADLTGKTVLDVGCQIGYFCFEAMKRGASQATGVDINLAALGEAKRIGECLGLPAQFRRLDIEREAIDGQYDYVICLNLMHHFKNPLSVLEKLIDATRQELILELPSFGRRDAKKFGLSRLAAWWLDRQPVLFAGPTGANSRHYSPKFGITPAAVRNILLHHRTTFAGVETKKSQFKQRHVVLGHKRHFDRIIVVAGPSGTGKSTMMKKLLAGELPDVAQRLDLGEPASWTTIDATRLRRHAKSHIDRVIYHYNFVVRYMRRTQSFDREELLDPAWLARDTRFLTVWVDHATLMEQFDEAKFGEESTADDDRRVRYRRLRKFLEDPAKVAEYYREWFEYVQRRTGNEPAIYYPRDGGAFLTVAEWEQRVAR